MKNPFMSMCAEQREPCARRGPRHGDGRDAPSAERRRQGGDARRRLGRGSEAEEEAQDDGEAQGEVARRGRGRAEPPRR